MILQCIFFTDIYLLVIYVCFFLSLLLSCGGQTELMVEKWALIGILSLC